MGWIPCRTSFTSSMTMPHSKPQSAQSCANVAMPSNPRICRTVAKRLPENAGVSCILLDIKIPGLRGPELQGRLNARGSSVPIDFVSGDADIPTTVGVMKGRAEDLLTKPVTTEALVQAVERADARFRCMREKNEQLDVLRTWRPSEPSRTSGL